MWPRRNGRIDDDIIYSLRFTYAEMPAKRDAEAAAKQLDSQLDNASSHRPHNIDYWYCGEPSLRPIGASDDGVHTRLSFAANAELPAIFVRNADDSESFLNFSVDAGDVVIHRVAQRFILRRGNLTGCVVNRGYAGGGKQTGIRHGGPGGRTPASRRARSMNHEESEDTRFAASVTVRC